MTFLMFHTQHIPDLDGGAEGGQRVPLLAEQDPTHWPQGCLAEVLDYAGSNVPDTSGLNIRNNQVMLPGNDVPGS